MDLDNILNAAMWTTPEELHERLMASDDRIKAEVFRENLEDDDCGIIATAAVTGLNYEETQYLLDGVFRATASGRGVSRLALFNRLRDRGWIVDEIEVPYNCTVAMVESRFPDGRYFIGMPNHIMALVDGELFNGRGSWGAPVDGIAHVLPNHQLRADPAEIIRHATRSKRV